MAGSTHYIKIDKSKTLAEEPHTGHNRWHQGIPPIVTIDPGDTVVMEARNAWDSQFNKDTSNEDHRSLLPAHRSGLRPRRRTWRPPRGPHPQDDM
jgi:acetamidase/formamidase